MELLTFKVSARAARLIGRENVATASGAITELVKNSYDADASECLILFTKRYNKVPETLSRRELGEIVSHIPEASEAYVQTSEDSFELRDLSDYERMQLETSLDNVVNLWIVDNGHGMSEDVIRGRWMVIGTETKEIIGTSDGGRVFTGAKGIGRFALDRLGERCQMHSVEEGTSKCALWSVDWGDFEGSGKNIDEVQASLKTSNETLHEAIHSIGHLPKIPNRTPTESSEGQQTKTKSILFEHGTALRITGLHDKWDQRDSIKLKETLEALLPPRERGDFNIYVFDHRAPDKSGWIDNFPPDQFDYKMHALVDELGGVSISLDRREIDVPNIRASVFELKGMQRNGFRQSDFERGTYKYSTELSKILKKAVGDQFSDYLQVGPFEITLYFMKLNNPTKDNLKKYPQKAFHVKRRRSWLKNSGGIRLYRDNIRVRPYGEPNTHASDWLGLGQRVATNPAAASRIGWRVPPQQISGTISISKKDNPLLADQSNREGIANERIFAIFREIVIALIGEFERDRSYILNQFNEAFAKENEDEATLAEGNKIKEEVLKESDDSISSGRKNSGNADLFDSPPPKSSGDLSAVSKALDVSERKREEQDSELRVLRGMATLGTVLVSATHELKQIKANLGSRTKRMNSALDRVVDDVKLSSTPSKLSPYNINERWGREDKKIDRWINFALSAISEEKISKQNFDVFLYLDGIKEYWSGFLLEKNISLHISPPARGEASIRCHEIDLDSVFFNLIVNSIEAFIIPSVEKTRDIFISCPSVDDEYVEFSYSDTGPGLSDYFGDEEEIFMYGKSSKLDPSAADRNGTGIGMWILKGIVDDYGGKTDLISRIGEPHFKIKIMLPTHKYTGVVK